jgi:hypothetical protein
MNTVIQFSFYWLAAVAIIILAVRCAYLARTCRKLSGILYRQSAETGFYKNQVGYDMQIIIEKDREIDRLTKGVMSWNHEYARLVKDIKEAHPDFQPQLINIKSGTDGNQQKEL